MRVLASTRAGWPLNTDATALPQGGHPIKIVVADENNFVEHPGNAGRPHVVSNRNITSVHQLFSCSRHEGLDSRAHTGNAQRTLWESFLPESCLGLPAELEAVDQLLDDPVFFEPYRNFFDENIGRPSIPIETYLRLMFLKFRYRLGFEMLCREATDSISWQRFCRIPLGCAVPHPTTLMKITTRCGPVAIEGLNEALLTKASSAKVLKTNRVRADTTVVEANIAYPTDSGLLTKGVTKMARAVALIKAAGLCPRTKTRDRTRQTHKKVRSIAANLRRPAERRKTRSKPSIWSSQRLRWLQCERQETRRGTLGEAQSKSPPR